MKRTFALAVAIVALVAGVFAGAGSASDWQDCRASTKLGAHPHELLFRVHCDMEVTTVYAELEGPAILRRVDRNPDIRGGDAEDGFRCHRDHNTAVCDGHMGSEVTLVGSLRMRGNRCKTATLFGVQGGPECDSEDPNVMCPSIGYFAKLRDPRPSGCG